MAESGLLSTAEFPRASGDSATQAKGKFDKPESRTMRNAAGRVPPAQKIHIHHRKNAPRSRRAH